MHLAHVHSKDGFVVMMRWPPSAAHAPIPTTVGNHRFEALAFHAIRASDGRSRVIAMHVRPRRYGEVWRAGANDNTTGLQC